MNKLLIAFLMTIVLNSCGNKTETKKLTKFDKNGKLIVYSEEVYEKMWMKNRNLKVTIIDTFCINQKYKAIKDIKNGKLIYFGYHPREFKKLTKMLSKYGIETKEYLGSCIRMGDFEPDCYQKEMWEEIDKRYGENFIDSIFKIAQKEYIFENPNVEYIEDGIDLREKYKVKSKNSH